MRKQNSKDCDELANKSNKENKTSKFSPDIEEVPSALSMSNFTRCNVSLRGNGLKVLTANNFIPSQTPIIECRGKYMLGSGNHRDVFAPPINTIQISMCVLQASECPLHPLPFSLPRLRGGGGRQDVRQRLPLLPKSRLKERGGKRGCATSLGQGQPSPVHRCQ